MSRLLAKMNRGLAPARSIQLFKDQEESLEVIRNELSKQGRKLPPKTEIVRMGVDMLIKQLEKELGIYEEEV